MAMKNTLWRGKASNEIAVTPHTSKDCAAAAAAWSRFGVMYTNVFRSKN
jgi:hypothetical protein